MKLLKILGAIIVGIIFCQLFSAIMNFFAIPFSTYGIYLAWFAAVAILTAVLSTPKKSILDS